MIFIFTLSHLPHHNHLLLGTVVGCRLGLLVLQRWQEEQEAEYRDQGDDLLEYDQLEDDLSDGEQIQLVLELVEDAEHGVGHLVERAVVRDGGKTVAVFKIGGID